MTTPAAELACSKGIKQRLVLLCNHMTLIAADAICCVESSMLDINNIMQQQPCLQITSTHQYHILVRLHGILCMHRQDSSQVTSELKQVPVS